MLIIRFLLNYGDWPERGIVFGFFSRSIRASMNSEGVVEFIVLRSVHINSSV